MTSDNFLHFHDLPQFSMTVGTLLTVSASVETISMFSLHGTTNFRSWSFSINSRIQPFVKIVIHCHWSHAMKQYCLDAYLHRDTSADFFFFPGCICSFSLIVLSEINNWTIPHFQQTFRLPQFLHNEPSVSQIFLRRTTQNKL